MSRVDIVITNIVKLCAPARWHISWIGLLRDYLSSSKFITKPRLRDVFSNFHCLRVVSTYVFFSSFLLCELVHDEIYILHYQHEAWYGGVFCIVWCHNGSYKFMHVSTYWQWKLANECTRISAVIVKWRLTTGDAYKIMNIKSVIYIIFPLHPECDLLLVNHSCFSALSR